MGLEKKGTKLKFIFVKLFNNLIQKTEQKDFFKIVSLSAAFGPQDH